MAPQHLPQGAETLQPLQMKTALCQQGFGLLAADLAIFQRFTYGPLHPIQRPQRLLARLLEILCQHGQGIRQYPFGEAVVRFLAKQPIVGAEPLLDRLQVGLDGGQCILQFELGVEQALLIKSPRQLACTLYQLLQPAARAFDAGRRRAVIPGDGGQVMGLIQHIDALIRGRQNDAAAHGEIGEQ